jgi:hypothetical protein
LSGVLKTSFVPEKFSTTSKGLIMEQNSDKPSPTQATYRYVDRPELAETFADSIHALFFDGQSLRIEFGVSRVDEVKSNVPVMGRRYPACRLVLTPAAAIDLINRMQQVASALTQAGILKPAHPATMPTPPASA